jgi:hypothetical protein
LCLGFQGGLLTLGGALNQDPLQWAPWRPDTPLYTLDVGALALDGVSLGDVSALNGCVCVRAKGWMGGGESGWDRTCLRDGLFCCAGAQGEG